MSIIIDCMLIFLFKEKQKQQENVTIVHYYYDKEYTSPPYNVGCEWFDRFSLDHQVRVMGVNMTYFLHQANDTYNMCL